MRIRTCYYGILTVLVTFLWCFPGEALAQVDLFEDASAQRLAPEQSSRLSSIRSLPTSAEVNVVRITSLTPLSRGQTVTLNVFSGTRFTARNEEVKRISAQAFTWIGQPAEAPGLVVLSVREDRVTGTIRVGKELYKVQPLGNGLHAVIRVDESKFPPEHPPGFGKENSTNARIDTMDAHGANLQGPQPNSSSGGTIRLLVAYTTAAANAAGDIEGLIQTAITETNQSYENSNISASVVLAHSDQVGYDESGRSYFDHSEFLQDPNDGVLDGVHSLRDQHYADVVVLLVDDQQYCGIAYEIYAEVESEAFAVVHYNCATGNYSFGHEIGHLQGARHDPYVDPTDEPFPYGHGYVDPDDDWRTVMAYPHACFGCDRLPYWSNPDVTYDGDPMGTAANEDNARVLNNTSDEIAAFRPSPPSVSITSGPNRLDEGELGTWMASVSGGYSNLIMRIRS